jgi:hypothetical protein
VSRHPRRDDPLLLLDHIDVTGLAGRLGRILKLGRLCIRPDLHDHRFGEANGNDIAHLEIVERLAQLHYPHENESEFAESFAADFIVEYVAQSWFYTLHVLATALFEQQAFKPAVRGDN